MYNFVDDIQCSFVAKTLRRTDGHCSLDSSPVAWWRTS